MARRPRGENPHYVDLHVGGRIRSRRRELRLSLEALAAALGITHQQMQKYETGGNRINVAMLYEIAGALRTWVGDFYEGLPSPGDVSRLDPRARDQVQRLLVSPGGRDLMAAFVDLPAHLQKPLVEIARASVHVDPARADANPDEAAPRDAEPPR